jgi:hypothetical protein
MKPDDKSFSKFKIKCPIKHGEASAVRFQASLRQSGESLNSIAE